jgi:hypothetical protein
MPTSLRSETPEYGRVPALASFFTARTIFSTDRAVWRRVTEKVRALFHGVGCTRAMQVSAEWLTAGGTGAIKRFDPGEGTFARPSSRIYLGCRGLHRWKAMGKPVLGLISARDSWGVE